MGSESLHHLASSVYRDLSELTALLNPLYNLLPLPAASSALVEVLSESIFKFGKGTKVLTEPLLGWITGPAGQTLFATTEGGKRKHPHLLDKLTEKGRPIRGGHRTRKAALRTHRALVRMARRATRTARCPSITGCSAPLDRMARDRRSRRTSQRGPPLHRPASTSGQTIMP